MKNLLLKFISLFLIVTACQTSELVKPFSDEIKQINSGQSFGMCMGKCYNELLITDNKLVLKQIERKERGGETVTHEFTENNSLTAVKPSLLTISKSDFLSLEDQYGCPDCADGGAEWLEIEFNDGKTKKVTFEYGGTIKGFESIVSTLREERLSLIEKHR